jgi:hypothetical protein
MMTDSQSSLIFAFMIVSPEDYFGEDLDVSLIWGAIVGYSPAEAGLPLPAPSAGQMFLS